MRLIRDSSNLPDSLRHAVVALGNFDGLHRGHQAILEHTLERAEQMKAPAAVLTFEPHPREFFQPASPKLRLMSLREKCDALRDMGFSALLMLRFNSALAATSADDFIRNILAGQLAVRHIVTGEDFCFGSSRNGNKTLLAQASSLFGYSAIPPVMDAQQIISSTAIRRLLCEGKLEEVFRLLGRHFTICGHVTHGDKRGRQLGFPTANIPLSELFLPRAGVYAVEVDGHKGVANIGIRPSFGGTQPRAEIHLFDFSGNLYGRYLRVKLLAFLRDERHFPSADALIQQINFDCEQAKNL